MTNARFLLLTVRAVTALLNQLNVGRPVAVLSKFLNGLKFSAIRILMSELNKAYHDDDRFQSKQEITSEWISESKISQVFIHNKVTVHFCRHVSEKISLLKYIISCVR